jgi:hypothetical protein
MAYNPITATHVGNGQNLGPSKRICKRCGMERTVKRANSPTVYMCWDCKTVDPAMARRLGLLA